MKPIYQTHFGPINGNCLVAAFASILELEDERLPALVDGDDWWDRFSTWLRPFGIVPLCVDLDAEHIRHLLSENGGIFDAWIVVGGDSPRGDWGHAVVWRRGRMEHDPHPSGIGLIGPPKRVYVLVVLDAASVEVADPRYAGKTHPYLEVSAETDRMDDPIVQYPPERPGPPRR